VAVTEGLVVPVRVTLVVPVAGKAERVHLDKDIAAALAAAGHAALVAAGLEVLD
jgi:hypothetical protein